MTFSLLIFKLINSHIDVTDNYVFLTFIQYDILLSFREIPTDAEGVI
jgi:hypothetical protein